MAETVDRPEDPRTAEPETPGDGAPNPDPASAVAPARRFYANLADL